MDIPLGLTFDDVLLRPAESSVLPSMADTSTRLTRDIALNIPILSSAMDTVTEADMAIAMAQLGGIGVLHRNLDIDAQCAAVRAVKRYESGMVVNPITIGPDATLGEAQTLMQLHRISGIPVVDAGGKLVGILTNRDVRFAENPLQPVRELMTTENLATVSLGTGQEEARRLLHARRIEKLLVVDDAFRCIGLITVKDIEKAVNYPHATKDGTVRLPKRFKSRAFRTRYGEEALMLEFGRASRTGDDVGIIVGDLDHFKSINDAFGHLHGDDVLVEIARRCQRALRATDLLARWGGEEFILLLPETDDATARELNMPIRWRGQGEQEQQADGHHAVEREQCQGHGHQRHPHLDLEQVAALVDDVGHGTRWKSQKEHRRGACNLHQGNVHGAG